MRKMETNPTFREQYSLKEALRKHWLLQSWVVTKRYLPMHRVASTGNTSNSTRPRREKRLTYVLTGSDDTKHCAGINCLAVLQSSIGHHNYLFSGSRDGTLKRWELVGDSATCTATFESHVDWCCQAVGRGPMASQVVCLGIGPPPVSSFTSGLGARFSIVNDVVLAGETLVSCSSDTTLKTWNCLSDGTCTRTYRQHSDYVTCLASAEKNSNTVSSGGLGGEVFIWDLEAAAHPISRSADDVEDDSSNGILSLGNTGLPISSMRSINSSSGNGLSLHAKQSQGYCPLAAKGHKESVYALAMNDSGTLLVSGGTEKVVRVWDPRSGSKKMKLRGHTDNIRALLVDSSGRFCLSGSSDSMIRLWDLGQQRCVHSYAVHTDSVWALMSTPTFSHVYSGGRDLSLYLTDLSTRESLLLCTKEHPILQMALEGDGIWVATTDSSLHKWPAEGCNPQKVFQRGSSFLAGNLSFTRARASLEGSTPVPVYKNPSCTIPGTPGIVQHEILNNRRHVLTKDAAGSVKLWEITRGAVVENYGKVSFEEKKEELFEMVSIPSWFTMDTRLGSMSIHLDMPQCFSAEMYATDLNISGASEEQKINLAQETLRGLLSHWIAKRKQKSGSQPSANGDVPTGREISIRSHPHSRLEVDDGIENQSSAILPSFAFSAVSPPSIITEGSTGGPWRKKITDLDGSEDEKELPGWCLDCVLNGRMPPRENSKCSFYLQPYEGTTVQVLTQGKLSAPRILRIHKVINYVIEKMVLDKPLENNSDGTSVSGKTVQSPLPPIDDGSFRTGLKPWQKPKPSSVEILCNNQLLDHDMSLATVKAYIWKKPEDLVIHYKVTQR